MKKSKTALTSKNEKMDMIADQMANYFDENITPYDLSKWVSTSNANCLEFGSSLTEVGDPLDAVHFLNEIGIYILSEIIDTYKGEGERIELLTEQLISIFENRGYNGTKSVIADIGVNHIEHFKKYPRTEIDWPFDEFLKVFNCFLNLVNMFREYEKLNMLELKRELKVA